VAAGGSPNSDCAYAASKVLAPLLTVYYIDQGEILTVKIYTTMTIIALALIGCSAVPITKDGAQVRQIQHNDASPCKFIRVIDVSGGMFYSSLPEAKRDMLAKLRNETASANGNAFAITAIVAERGVSKPFAQADAYKCP
jgi:hypothetical protein